MKVLDRIPLKSYWAFKREIRLYLDKYATMSVEELKWNNPNEAEFRGVKYKFDVANTPKPYAGFHYCYSRGSANDMDRVMRHNGCFEVYHAQHADQVFFKTKEEAIAVLEKSLGILPSVCRCELRTLMTQGCCCGAFKREREKQRG